MVTKPEVLEIPREDLESLLERVRPSLPEEDFRKLKAVLHPNAQQRCIGDPGGGRA